MLDEPLLRRLDADPEVQKVGRSAVLRRAAAAYLRQSQAQRISVAYQQAYGDGEGLDDDLAGWANEGVWPEK